MKLINRLSDSNVKTQYELFQQGSTVHDKDIHIINSRGKVKVYEQQITPLLRDFKQRFLNVIH